MKLRVALGVPHNKPSEQNLNVMAGFIRKVFRRKQKNNVPLEIQKDELLDATVPTFRDSFRKNIQNKSFHKSFRKSFQEDPNGPLDQLTKNEKIINHIMEEYHKDSLIDSNHEVILKQLIEQHRQDCIEQENLEKQRSQLPPPNIKYSKISSEASRKSTKSKNLHVHQQPPVADIQDGELKPRDCPSAKTLLNRPWLIKMKTNNEGVPTLKCYALDDDGDMMQVVGEVVAPSDESGKPVKPAAPLFVPVRQTLKLREIPPSPRCHQHKHLVGPKKYEVVRETLLSATIHTQRVNNGRASLTKPDHPSVVEDDDDSEDDDESDSESSGRGHRGRGRHDKRHAENQQYKSPFAYTKSVREQRRLVQYVNDNNLAAIATNNVIMQARNSPQGFH